MVEQLDLSEFSSKKETAEAIGKKIREVAEEVFDQDPELEVTVDKRTNENGEFFIVSWPGGPFEWAVRMTGGTPIVGVEPTIVGFRSPENAIVEAKNGSTLGIYDY
jgi:hypothetical protein